jgi:hypothetical protein
MGAQMLSSSMSEYKIGRRHGDAAHVQLCAQSLCLEEMLALPVAVG